MEVARGKLSVTSLLYLLHFGSSFGLLRCGGASESSARASQGTSGGRRSRATLIVLAISSLTADLFLSDVDQRPLEEYDFDRVS